MPDVECGFRDHEGIPARDLLVTYGPTLQVDIGFDPDYDSSQPQRLPLSALRQVRALIDTGATISCIDRTLAAKLALPVVDRQNFGGIGGLYLTEMHSAQSHVPTLNFTVHGLFAGVDLLGGGQQHVALIGRTFLQSMRMIYEGPTGRVILGLP